MSCEKCSYTIGKRYYLYTGVTCTGCGHIHRAVDLDAEYIEFYGNLVHRFRPAKSFFCRRCHMEIKVVNYPCRDKDQRLAENKSDELVQSFFSKVLKK